MEGKHFKKKCELGVSKNLFTINIYNEKQKKQENNKFECSDQFDLSNETEKLNEMLLKIIKRIQEILKELENNLPYISGTFNFLDTTNFQINKLQYSAFKFIEYKFNSFNNLKTILDRFTLFCEFIQSQKYKVFDIEECVSIKNNVYELKTEKNKESTQKNTTKRLFMEEKEVDKLQFQQTQNNSEIINENEIENENIDENENDLSDKTTYFLLQNSSSTKCTSNDSFLEQQNNYDIIINNETFENNYSVWDFGILGNEYYSSYKINICLDDNLNIYLSIFLDNFDSNDN